MLLSPSCSSKYSVALKSSLLLPTSERNWTPDKSADETKDFSFLLYHIRHKLFESDSKLTKSGQGYASWLGVWEHWVFKHTDNAAALVFCRREPDGETFPVWICTVLSLHLFIFVQSQGNVSVRSPSGWNARDHPELISSSLYHLCFNRHVWPRWEAGRKRKDELFFL